MNDKRVIPTTHVYPLECGHQRETYQLRNNGQPLYCTECRKEVKVKI